MPDAVSPGPHTSLLIDGRGTLWVAYTDALDEDGAILKVAHRAALAPAHKAYRRPVFSGKWDIETVDEHASALDELSLGVAGDDTIWVGYHQGPERRLAAARRTQGLDPRWSVESVLTSGTPYGTLSLDTTAAGEVWVSSLTQGAYRAAGAPILELAFRSWPHLGIGYGAARTEEISYLCAPEADRESVPRAVPVFLRLGPDRCSYVSFGLAWDSETAVLDGPHTVVFENGPARKGTLPEGAAVTVADTPAFVGVEIDLSGVREENRLRSLFDEPLCYFYFRAAPGSSGGTSPLILTGFASDGNPQVKAAHDIPLVPHTRNGRLTVR